MVTPASAMVVVEHIGVGEDRPRTSSPTGVADLNFSAAADDDALWDDAPHFESRRMGNKEPSTEGHAECIFMSHSKESLHDLCFHE
jgi:hypothetical protein